MSRKPDGRAFGLQPGLFSCRRVRKELPTKATRGRTSGGSITDRGTAFVKHCTQRGALATPPFLAVEAHGKVRAVG